MLGGFYGLNKCNIWFRINSVKKELVSVTMPICHINSALHVLARILNC